MDPARGPYVLTDLRLDLPIGGPPCLLDAGKQRWRILPIFAAHNASCPGRLTACRWMRVGRRVLGSHASQTQSGEEIPDSVIGRS